MLELNERHYTESSKYLKYQEVATYKIVLPKFSSTIEKLCLCDYIEMSCLKCPVVQMYLFCEAIFCFFASMKFSKVKVILN